MECQVKLLRLFLAHRGNSNDLVFRRKVYLTKQEINYAQIFFYGRRSFPLNESLRTHARGTHAQNVIVFARENMFYANGKRAKRV